MAVRALTSVFPNHQLLVDLEKGQATMKNQHKFAQTRLSGVCTNPTIGEGLSTYIVSPLDDPAAEEVEDHLLECRHCREFYLRMVDIQAGERGKSSLTGVRDEAKTHTLKALRFAGFGN